MAPAAAIRWWRPWPWTAWSDWALCTPHLTAGASALPGDGIESVLATSLTAAYQSQIDRLSQPERDLLEAAAKIGHPFTAAQVANEWPSETATVIERRLETLARRQVLLDYQRGRPVAGARPEFRFRQPTVPQLLLDDAPLPRQLEAAAVPGDRGAVSRRA